MKELMNYGIHKINLESMPARYPAPLMPAHRQTKGKKYSQMTRPKYRPPPNGSTNQHHPMKRPSGTAHDATKLCCTTNDAAKLYCQKSLPNCTAK